jgi:type VI protein secretion system component VasF
MDDRELQERFARMKEADARSALSFLSTWRAAEQRRSKPALAWIAWTVGTATAAAMVVAVVGLQHGAAPQSARRVAAQETAPLEFLLKTPGGAPIADPLPMPRGFDRGLFE